jgi:glutamate 5-kinase
VEEIRIGDNDNLSALTSVLLGADVLILFSDIDGVYTGNPKLDSGATHIPVVEDIDVLMSSISVEGANPFGTGGMATKIEAARKVTKYGIPMILANGGVPQALSALAAGTLAATVFAINR